MFKDTISWNIRINSHICFVCFRCHQTPRGVASHSTSMRNKEVKQIMQISSWKSIHYCVNFIYLPHIFFSVNMINKNLPSWLFFKSILTLFVISFFISFKQVCIWLRVLMLISKKKTIYIYVTVCCKKYGDFT